MEVLAIIHAYETLKKHGLDLPVRRVENKKEAQEVSRYQAVRESGKERNQSVTKDAGYTDEGLNNILAGNIDSQKEFLQAEAARIRFENLDAAVDNGNLVDDGPIQEGIELPEVDLKNMKMSKLLDIKQLIDEIYGNGIFEKAVGEDLSRIISKVREEVSQQKRTPTANQEGPEETQPGFIGDKSKSLASKVKEGGMTFVEALTSSQGLRKDCSTEEAVPLIPSSLPRVEGATWWCRLTRRNTSSRSRTSSLASLAELTCRTRRT